MKLETDVQSEYIFLIHYKKWRFILRSLKTFPNQTMATAGLPISHMMLILRRMKCRKLTTKQRRLVLFWVASKTSKVPIYLSSFYLFCRHSVTVVIVKRATDRKVRSVLHNFNVSSATEVLSNIQYVIQMPNFMNSEDESFFIWACSQRY